jgi:hypothetical protein
MDTIETNFNKVYINHCADRCIVTYSRPQFTPDENRCFQQYRFPYLDAPITSSKAKSCYRGCPSNHRNQLTCSASPDPSLQLGMDSVDLHMH